MAGDWIKMRADLQTHPKVVRILSALRSDRLRVVGGLHAVWCIFDAHSLDGSLEGYTPEALDTLIGWPGFTEQLEAVGWISITPESLVLPRFDEHNGKSAKRRATETERKRAERNVRDMSASDADNEQTKSGLEKRREEKRDISPNGDIGAKSSRSVNVTAEHMVGTMNLLSLEVATEYLKYRKAKGAPLTSRAWSTICKEISVSGWTAEAALSEAMAAGWQGLKAEWLRNRSTGHATGRQGAGGPVSARQKLDASRGQGSGAGTGATYDGSFERVQ